MRTRLIILLQAWVGALAVILALAVGGAGALAHHMRVGNWPAQAAPIVAVANASDGIAAGACGVHGCGSDADRCGGDFCCGGHGPLCSGALIAPASIVLVAPFLSSERLIVGRTAGKAGVILPPDERPPRTL